MKSIQFRWIEAFRVVAMTGSTVDGAQLLGVDQSAISRRVAALETQLGVKLFERINRRLILTAAGTELLVEAEAAVEALERFRRRGIGLRTPMSGHLHVVTVFNARARPAAAGAQDLPRRVSGSDDRGRGRLAE
jgi:DNA-binding transcriptional LysR family regulator